MNIIIASIISKKAAAGIKYLVLDLKVGSASFFHSLDEAKIFGKQFVSFIIVNFVFICNRNTHRRTKFIK